LKFYYLGFGDWACNLLQLGIGVHPVVLGVILILYEILVVLLGWHLSYSCKLEKYSDNFF